LRLTRLLMLSPAEMTRDPRARRATATAHRFGFDVIAVCGQLTGEEPAPLEGVHVVRVGRLGRARPSHERAEQPVEPRALLELHGIYRLARLTLRTRRLWRAGRRVGPVNVVHAHDLDTLPAGWLLARRYGARLVYDAHELYSAFESRPPVLYWTAMLALERALARRADAVVTVNESIAEELERRLHLPRMPFVVLNAPELDTSDPDWSEAKSLRVVYQGALGPGRRLDDLLAALAAAPSASLTLRVVRTSREEIERAVDAHGLSGRVRVAEPLPPDSLQDGLRQHDVGVIFDRPTTPNSHLASPNKIFEYLMAGLAVVTPSLPELTRIVHGENVGLTFEPGDPAALGKTLERLAEDRSLLGLLRRRARSVALDSYNAERQARVLLTAWSPAPSEAASRR
jgi:glycogen(starch) synthase